MFGGRILLKRGKNNTRMAITATVKIAAVGFFSFGFVGAEEEEECRKFGNSPFFSS